MNEAAQRLEGKHIVFIAGEDEYSSEKTLAALAEETRAAYGARVTLLTAYPNPEEPANIPGLEALRQADLAVFYIRFRELPEEQFTYIREYVEAGKPVIGFRTSTHAFRYPEGHPLQEWNDKFGIEVLGAPWIRHFGHSSSTEVSVAWGAEGHPIAAGISARFAVRSWLYHTLPYPPAGAHILLNGHTVEPELKSTTVEAPRIHPVAWTRTTQWGGRVFTTTLGHPEDFAEPDVRKLIGQAIQWALDKGGEQQ